jgi:hypothetical protein
MRILLPCARPRRGPPGLGDDEPALRESQECLAYRRAADSEPGGELAVAQLLTRGEGAVDEPRALGVAGTVKALDYGLAAALATIHGALVL